MANMALPINGVLRSHTGSPIYQGLALYKLLTDSNKVFILSEDKSIDERWLREQKLRGYDDMIGPEVPMVQDGILYAQVLHARNSSVGAFELAVVPDPAVASKLLSVGITTLLFLQPFYIKEEFRPDSRKGIRSWGSIVDELDKQQNAFSEDPRVQ